MAHTFVNLTFHVVFSTKARIPCINEDLKQPLYGYMAGIVRQLGGKALIINGTSDHLHLLVQLVATLSVSEFVRIMKANSSKWVHQDKKIPRSKFGWQTGYGCFSVSKSKLSSAYKYVLNQEDHHKRVSFQEEFAAFLKQNGISYDERYIWE